MICPYCTRENASGALVCSSCSRDVAVPESLVAERDDLIRKRDMVRRQLESAKSEIETPRRRRKSQSV
jgi:hypothetical protein